MKFKICPLKLILWASFVTPLFSEPPEDAWSSLKRLGHKQVITSLDRDGSCLTGTLVSSSPNWIILALDKDHERQILRPLILRISLGGSSDLHSVLFSARSSWADIRRLENNQPKSLLVATTDGKEFRGRLENVTDDELNLYQDGKDLKFAKAYVSRIFLLHEKPAPERSGIERGILVPLELPKMLSHRAPVQLYDAAVPQDDTVFECGMSPNPKPLQP